MDKVEHIHKGRQRTVKIVGLDDGEEVFWAFDADDRRMVYNISSMWRAINADPEAYPYVSFPIELAPAVLAHFPAYDCARADALPIDVLCRPGIALDMGACGKVIDGFHRLYKLHALYRQSVLLGQDPPTTVFNCHAISPEQARPFEIEFFELDGSGAWQRLPTAPLEAVISANEARKASRQGLAVAPIDLSALAD